MADLDLDAITQRAEAATPGPWEADGREVSQHWSCPEPWQTVVGTEVSCMAYCYGGTAQGIEREADAEFIAHAREDIPALVREVRRLTAERDSLARWKAEARVVLNAFYDLARRVVPESALGRAWSDMLAEHVDRQAAALAEAEAEVARLSGPHRCCPCCADDPVHDVEPDQHTIECTWCGPGAARAALREVAALHRRVLYDGVEWCAECVSADDDGMVAWPCPTARALARHSGGESDGPARHISAGANAEDCPACCAGVGGPLPYPFICPGEPGGESDG